MIMSALRRVAKAGLAAAVGMGLPHRWLRYRCVERESVSAYITRVGGADHAAYETIHEEATADHPLPINGVSREALPDDAGWWGFSFRDVPQRRSGATFRMTIPRARVISYREAARDGDFYPAILTDDRHALDLRELRYRPPHGRALCEAGRPTRLERATWFIERVYHNHSHWLTAHLPKLLLLRDRGELDEVLLPAERTEAMDRSMRMVGIDPARFRTFRTGELLRVERLTILGTDRFRPELLRLVPEALGVRAAPPPRRRVYISRAKANRRRLLNEAEVWALLEPEGFEKVCMEDLPFERQVELMRETAMLVAPHGAGLTNMLFCPAGACVVEIADASFANPNFYALASALGHRYAILGAAAEDAPHPVERDLRVDPHAVQSLVHQLCTR